MTTQIIRHALDSAARQMKRATIRTAFSPIIYEALDFAVVLYDTRMRMLAQAPTLPIFVGTMGFCIEGAVRAVGGQEQLESGDVLIYNVPYGTGSHAQDCAIVMPVFLPEGELIGYAANKAHWLDIGAKAPYCTDTTDVYQEGVVIPGVKLYKAGKLNGRTSIVSVIANRRLKKACELGGTSNAQVAVVTLRRRPVPAGDQGVFPADARLPSVSSACLRYHGEAAGRRVSIKSIWYALIVLPAIWTTMGRTIIRSIFFEVVVTYSTHQTRPDGRLQQSARRATRSDYRRRSHQPSARRQVRSRRRPPEAPTRHRTKATFVCWRSSRDLALRSIWLSCNPAISTDGH